MRRLVAMLFGAALAAPAQTLPHVVLTGLPGSPPAPLAQLVEVDPVTGATTLMPRFPSDGLAPLAVTFDRVDGAVLVALDQGGGQSRIVRLDRVGATFMESPIATVPGRVIELVLAAGDLVAAVDAANGGLYRMPRRGGSATLVLQRPNLTALDRHWSAADAVELAWTGRAGTAVTSSGTGLYDLTSSQFALGPHSFANPGALEVTGVVHVPGIYRQFLSFSDGTFAMFRGYSSPALQPVLATPSVPPGGAAAMHPPIPFPGTGMVVGGAAYPFLYEIDIFSGAVMLRSAALPGAPVDFAFGISLIGHSEPYGGECGAISLSQTWIGIPSLTASFAVGVTGPANTPVFLAGGLTDFAGGVLPALLPGGCLLEVSPDAVLFATLPANGRVDHWMNLPASTAFISTVLFFQWVHFAPTGLSTSNAAAHWIGL